LLAGGRHALVGLLLDDTVYAVFRLDLLASEVTKRFSVFNK
jgi:hypothetical protein